MAELNDSLTFKHGATIANRFVQPPMLTNSGIEGEASSDTINYYKHHSKSGGMIITEYIYVSPEGGPAISWAKDRTQLAVYDDKFIPQLKKVAAAMKSSGNKAIMQGEDKVSGVETDQGVVPADLVIVSAGVTPNTAWLKGTVDLDQRGWIKTDPYLRTNVKDVYAIGDAILPLSIPAGKPMPIALATTARREAQYLVNHLFEAKPDKAFKGVTGASALSVFDYHFATAGLNQFSAKRNDVPYATSFYEDSMRPAYIPEKDNPKVYVSLTFNPYSHQILGGAVLSKYDITAQGNVLALAISHKMTLEDLAEQDFFFQPGFDRQWSLLNLAAQHALGLAKF